MSRPDIESVVRGWGLGQADGMAVRHLLIARSSVDPLDEWRLALGYLRQVISREVRLRRAAGSALSSTEAPTQPGVPHPRKRRT